MGLRVTGRCPECGTRVVESLYVASVQRDRQVASRSRLAFEVATFRSDWRLAIVLGAVGAVLACGAVVLAAAGVGSAAHVGACVVVGVFSGGGMLAGLLLSERLGIAGFPSRRSIVALVFTLHVFALGAALAIGLWLAAGVVVLATPLLAAVPLAILVRRNSPEPWLAMQIVVVGQGIALVGLMVARIAA